MGIPSYFSYIIKNHRRIIETFAQIKSSNVPFDSLYMDCNSIIYDVYYKWVADGTATELSHDFIIEQVIIIIQQYIDTINPNRLVYIAFDGVAPLAKMEQQRTRRYKSWFLSETIPSIHTFVTAEITPGTQFMTNLSSKINAHFFDKYCDNRVICIVSGSDVPGEGEHKMFHHIRQNIDVLANNRVAVYGLDSDLIMLSIFHCFIRDIANNNMAASQSKNWCNIYIFREATEFVKSITGLSTSNEPYFLNIIQLALSILTEMTGKSNVYDSRDISRIYDYVFLCFMLGNDFLPHFPAMNIRTHGIQVLLDMYKTHIGKYNTRMFIKNGKISWQWFSHYIKELAKYEHEWLVQEITIRDKMDGRFFPNVTAKDREQIVNNAPIIHREKEKYISVNEDGWQERYYRTLFSTNTTNSTDFIKDICINYLEGLEWVFKYYTSECADWNWQYKHHYPPLLTDLQKFMATNNNDVCEFITNGTMVARSPAEQLAYVLPPAYSYLLSSDSHISLHPHPPKFKFEWAFCRYFWESHITFDADKCA